MSSYVTRLADIVAAIIATAMLSGCMTTAGSSKYAADTVDPARGIVVGTVFERAVFTPYGVYFYILSPDGSKIVLTRDHVKGQATIWNDPPKVPKGEGTTFSLQLPPGKYQIVGWALNYGTYNRKASEPYKTPIEFSVEPGKTIYIGRLDANRFMEIASIHDNYEEDASYLQKVSFLKGLSIENKALNIKGWWLPNATGKDMLKGEVANKCSQC
ncbi:hypothetical protein [Herbaspirillum robiniae]|uniref:DUF2846 domain-containing protein n=1 Tax=Herbaspirillum robiniae TaxID=2014887 RepID=A0ABX2LW86_9BURK|nr:hypothetical protein [Herbaspirillum robiniae]NUU01473.1 hypothetical protein [Herbaspirillum robiniae]